MNIAQLHRLSRQLHDLALQSTAGPDSPPLSPGQLMIVEDIYAHVPTTIGAIARRTLLAQSFVSKTVAAMIQADFLSRQPSPTDKRQSLICVRPEAHLGLATPHSQQSITPILSRAYPEASVQGIAAIESALTNLAALLPRAGPRG